MRLLRLVRRHPIALLGVFAAAFVVWLWRDSLPVNPQVMTVEGPPRPPLQPRPFPAPPNFDELEAGKPTPQDTAQVLSKLKPGMTRAEVEGLVGLPADGDIHPATVADGRVTYHTSYEADLGPAPTVRPTRIPRPRTQPGEPNSTPRTLVTLEYDASKPGHPLLGIHYPDPLF